MALALYDTARRRTVPFAPRTPDHVSLYHCGPTVYATPHVGNFRSFLTGDLLRRQLEAEGYTVRQVMNITDVGHLTEDDRADASGEDKLHRAARSLGWDPFRVARHFEELFHRDRRRLGIVDAHHYPRATEHVPHMLDLIQELLDAGHAYVVDGEVYFDVGSYPAYGAISGRHLDEQRAGARVQVRDGKRHPADFALWKVDEAHLMQFDVGPHIDARIRRGFPGWHIECSAMARALLGDTVDVHTGGEDNLFPHHECEAAQSTAATGHPLARFWMHTRHLLVDGKKLSKRDGTAVELDELQAQGFAPRVVRFALLSHHYRKPMNLTTEGLVAARSAVAHLDEVHDTLRAQAGDEASHTPHPMAGAFHDALNDDLDVPNALAALFDAVGQWRRTTPSGSEARDALAALRRVDGILGVLQREVRSGTVALSRLQSEPRDVTEVVAALQRSNAASVEAVLIARHAARRDKRWPDADALRDALGQAGVEVRDLDDGVAWSIRADVPSDATP
ncbi:MAG: cysteine--tRNA ligase [Myxococcales bacterium]|nr:cysteine--tRNA ligase [Myxococcales bacterium]